MTTTHVRYFGLGTQSGEIKPHTQIHVQKYNL